MAERLLAGRKLNVNLLQRQGRTPQVIEGWATGPYCIVPPDRGAELLNDQSGEFSTGYGDIIPLTEKQVGVLKSKLGKVSSRN